MILEDKEVGNRYGYLQIMYRAPDHISSSGKKYTYYHCKCDCGKEKDIAISSLRSGATKSCGCLQKRRASETAKKDLTGQKFGKLTALEPTNQRKFGNIVWKCQCDCGNIHYVTTNALTQLSIQSCGCLAHNSKGEDKIKQLLIENNIPFETEKTFKDCFYNDKKAKCRFDFYINNLYLIEYDGKQHYIKDSGFGKELEEIKIRDRIKTEYCKNNNIPLIRIPYTHYDELKIEDLLLETTTFLEK